MEYTDIRTKLQTAQIMLEKEQVLTANLESAVAKKSNANSKLQEELALLKVGLVWI